jgi:phage terminase small subunit
MDVQDKKAIRSARRGGRHSRRSAQQGTASMTAKQRRFIDEFLVDYNGTAAAIRAGYSASTAKQAASKLRRTPAVQKEIDRREAERAVRVDVKSDDVLRELKRVAFFDIRTLFKDGKFITDPSELPEDVARGLATLDVVVLNRDGDHIIKINPGNKLKALELLGRHLKMFTDRVEAAEKSTVLFSVEFGDDD